LFASWLPVSGPDSPAPIVFVENYTVYYIPDVSSRTKKIYPISQEDQVVPEVVIHGIPDWIYEGDNTFANT
jgi:hypothetical protein